MKIVVEGADGVGKSTLVNKLVEELNFPTAHPTSETENTYQYDLELLSSSEDIIIDRLILSEIVYSSVFSRVPLIDMNEFMLLLEEIDVMIIMYASNDEDLVNRLKNRGSLDEYERAIEANNIYKVVAPLWAEYDNKIKVIDISKEGENKNDWRSIIA